MQDRTGGGLSVTVLGCATPYPRPGLPCSGYLIRTPQAAVWVDCGSGTFAALQEHTKPEELTAVWLSHLHPDHCADLLSAFNWAANTPTAPRLPIYGPPGWAARLAAMLPQDDAAALVHEAFEVHDLTDGDTAQAADIELHSLAVQHAVPAFGMRAEHAGTVIAYSGDTGPCPALTQLARNADLFICEAGAIEPQPTHCTPQDAGRAAAQANALRLMLTHLPSTADPSDAADTAGGLCECPTTTAVPGITINLDSR